MVKKALTDLREVTLLNRLKPVTAVMGSPLSLSVLYSKLRRNIFVFGLRLHNPTRQSNVV